MRHIITLIVAGLVILPSVAAAEVLSVAPEHPIQGDPLLVTVNVREIPVKLTFAGAPAPLFSYAGTWRSLIPIDINRAPGTYFLRAVFKDGSAVTRAVTVGARVKFEAPLSIPAKLGGTTAAAATAVVGSLSAENSILDSLWSGNHAYWTKPFRLPLAEATVTDPYGYNRKTGEYTIAHKGTDFHAPRGTPVYAMNRGVVRLTRNWIIYGKIIVIDHGLGLQTMYLHLSKIYVSEGELVQPGEIIGLSGDTGYALAPHLHLSVKLAHDSIDPVTFLDFFGWNL